MRSRTWITSFFLPENQQAELGELVQQFPQISLLDVNAILATLQDIIAQASRAAFVVGVLLLLAALLVLMAALLAMIACLMASAVRLFPTMPMVTAVVLRPWATPVPWARARVYPHKGRFRLQH